MASALAASATRVIQCPHVPAAAAAKLKNRDNRRDRNARNKEEATLFKYLARQAKDMTDLSRVFTVRILQTQTEMAGGWEHLQCCVNDCTPDPGGQQAALLLHWLGRPLSCC